MVLAMDPAKLLFDVPEAGVRPDLVAVLLAGAEAAFHGVLSPKERL